MTTQPDEAGPPVSPDGLLPLIRSGYALPEPVACAWLSSGLNDVFEVTAGAECFVLKVYRAGWRDRADVSAEIAALEHLARRGVPVARPVSRRDGEHVWALNTAPGGRPATLFGWAPGAPVTDLDPPRCRLLGRALAGIHAATADFAAAPVRYDLDNLLDRPLAGLEPFFAERADMVPGELPYLQELAGRLRERFVGLAPRIGWGYCHGDFRASNLHLDPDTCRVTAFDLELDGLGFRAYDLAYFQTTLHPLALEVLWGGAPVPDAHEASWAAFLKGYADGAQVSAAERRAIPLLVALRAFRILGDIAEAARSGRTETWPPIPPGGGLPGGNLFAQAVRFLHAWDDSCLS